MATVLGILAVVLLAQPGASAQRAPGPAFSVANAAGLPRDQVVLASVPYPMGALPPGERPLRLRLRTGQELLPALGVPLMHWRDGTVAVLQVQARLPLAAHSQRRCTVEPWAGAEDEWPELPAATDSPLARPLPLRTEVVDPWGRTWTARLEPDPSAGPGGVLSDSGLVRTLRFRSLHRRRDEQGADQAFLGLRAYLTLFGGEARGELTLLLDNTDLPQGPLGPVRLHSFSLVSTDPRLRFLPRFAEENALQPAEELEDGGYRQVLLGPARNLYLGDQTAKAFRFALYWQDPAASDDELRAARAAAMPLRPLPDLDWVRATAAFGAHGGPAPRLPGDRGNAGLLLERWRRQARFGPFGGFGDPEDASVQGTARNGPCALHNPLRWNAPELLEPAEGMVLQHCLRPTPGRKPAEPADLAAFRQGLGPLARAVPHGFTALDYEHFSVDLLFDWYWLTGDPLARDELVRAGRGLRDLLAALPFHTSRGEGWCNQAGALIARATGERELAEWLARRFAGEIRPEIGGPRRGFAIRQPPHPQAMGGDPFDAPWQMAALVHGLHALYRETGDPALAEAAVEVAETMAGPGWVEGKGPKYFVSALDPTRYTMPVGFEPTAGTAWMEIGAFVLASELTGDAVLRRRFDSRIDFLLDPLQLDRLSLPRLVDLYANPWLQLVLDRRGRRR